VQKNDFFIKAIKAKAYEYKNWVISCFSITHEDKDQHKVNPYPYRVIQSPMGSFFIDPENNNEQTLIEGYSIGSPIFSFKDRISLKAGDLENLNTDIETTVGNVLFNQMCLVNAFGNKIGYMNKRISIPEIEDIIASKLTDNPEPNSIRDPVKIYVDEYIKFVDSVFYLTNFSQLCVWGATEKAITAPTGLKEFKQKLIEENKDKLNDPAVIAKIDAALVQFDSEYLKGDPSENYLISSKSRNMVRKRRFLMYGAESGFDAGVKVDPIINSLEEGWDISKMPTMINVLRAGSYNRGASTALGGEAVKWLLRDSSNMVVTIDDCGTTIGKPLLVNNSNHKRLVDFTVLLNNESKFIQDESESSQYIGKYLMVRSPMYCKLEKTDYCKTCVGKKLADNPTGLSMAVSDYGSTMLYIYMSAVHGKQLKLAKVNHINMLS
jgi:hypothetical protein